MGASSSINFFGVDLSTLNKDDLRKALYIFTRQPRSQPGYKSDSLRELQKTFMTYQSSGEQFSTRFLERVRLSMCNQAKVEVQFAREFDQVVLNFTNWYNNPNLDVLFLGVSEKERERITDVTTKGYTLVIDSHATTFIFQKTEGELILVYFNSHRKKSHHFGERMAQYIRDNVTVHVNPIFRTEDVCPVFQTGYQGGNCSLWQLFILSLFMLNPQYISTPNVIYKWIERQNPAFISVSTDTPNPNYLILLFEMFVWYKFGTFFPEYFQQLYNESREPRNDHTGLYEDFNIRLYLNNTLQIPWCSSFALENCKETVDCTRLNNTCVYRERTNATLLELKDILQYLMKNLLQEPNDVPRIEAVTQIESYSTERYTQVHHYVCSLAVDLITFLLFFKKQTTLNMARLYSSFFQINLQCPQLFKLFLQIISHWPSFENCLDYVFSESGADLSVLQYHCPTAAKFRYLLSEGKEEDLLVAPDNTVLYTTSKPFNITLSSSLMQLNYGGEGLPLCAAVNQPENAYNYVLFKKPTTPRLHYLDKAVWNGFLQQIILTQNEFKIMKIARGMQIETRQINYFPSLPIITHLPVVTPP